MGGCARAIGSARTESPSRLRKQAPEQAGEVGPGPDMHITRRTEVRCEQYMRVLRTRYGLTRLCWRAGLKLVSSVPQVPSWVRMNCCPFVRLASCLLLTYRLECPPPHPALPMRKVARSRAWKATGFRCHPVVPCCLITTSRPYILSAVRTPWATLCYHHPVRDRTDGCVSSRCRGAAADLCAICSPALSPSFLPETFPRDELNFM
jgi:hypothetical protein